MAPPSTEQFLALSCANVGVGPGGTTTMLARVSIVDYKGAVVFDKFVSPTMPVTDYRTVTTGITSAHLQLPEAWPFQAVQQHVANLFKGKILVGHSIWNDLSVLGIPHPAVATRDVALYQPFRNALRSPHQSVGLSTLSFQLLCRRCQEGQINPVENARVALDLYRSDADDWEGSIGRGNWPCALPPSTFSRCYL
ncbi:ribonuclease H-like domain-containing protein [Ephemerocybe angulata]|uniref:RNA exonuclease 4 n=1 Tax=Ephemerocybe angulata TaxID=980116 RepID=A0A8H6ME86_9AGAR|nr:ribonuclease H-like domain-containing protein [Tulosesus angulatus]